MKAQITAKEVIWLLVFSKGQTSRMLESTRKPEGLVMAESGPACVNLSSHCSTVHTDTNDRMGVAVPTLRSTNQARPH